ncbi:hypothetical protein AB1Y20_007567 [Prymnesium parvum]|uniref:Transmembrane protein 242 n=1 Tax=Prymnesium parvum TaxID=97485 RepID=A0AB34IY97_PRYPA
MAVDEQKAAQLQAQSRQGYLLLVIGLVGLAYFRVTNPSAQPVDWVALLSHVVPALAATAAVIAFFTFGGRVFNRFMGRVKAPAIKAD